MYNSWYYVKELVKNLNIELKGITFQTPFTYKKNEIYLPFSGNCNMHCLHMVIKNPVPYFMIENNIPKQRQVVKILKKLTGSILNEVLFHKDDRQILFILNNHRLFLLVQIYGINGNLFLLDQEFNIIENFKNRKNIEIPDKSMFISTEPKKVNLNWENFFNHNQDQTLFQFLKHLPLKFFSNNLRNEICHRLSIDKNELIYNLPVEQKDNMIIQINAIISQMKAPEYYFYNTEMPIFSLIKLTHLSHEEKKVDSFFDLQRLYVSNSFRYISFTNTKKSLLKIISNYHDVVIKRLVKSRKSLAGLPQSFTYRQYGDAILSNLYKIKKGQKEILLPSHLNPGETLLIPLDPKLTPNLNASQYFKGAHKIEDAKKELEKSIISLTKEDIKIQQLVKKFENAESPAQLKLIEENIPKKVIRQNIRDESTIRTPYKKYFYKKWEILVGKSSRDNDELTFKVASKMDFWLHASKVPGSHVIVKNPHKLDSLPSDVIIYAASIAAFFCKIKHSRIVPVNYTKKKYVWKRKQMAPGQVNINYEKTVIVEPINPAG